MNTEAFRFFGWKLQVQIFDSCRAKTLVIKCHYTVLLHCRDQILLFFLQNNMCNDNGYSIIKIFTNYDIKKDYNSNKYHLTWKRMSTMYKNESLCTKRVIVIFYI